MMIAVVTTEPDDCTMILLICVIVLRSQWWHRWRGLQTYSNRFDAKGVQL